MSEKFEKQKLSDDELEDINGGGIISDLIDIFTGKKEKKDRTNGQVYTGDYKCLACGKPFTWFIASAPICPNCREMNNLRRTNDLATDKTVHL